MFLELDIKSNIGEDEKYKFETIKDSTINNKAVKSKLAKLYYLVFKKSYLENESIWELGLAIIHLQKFISIFYKHYSKKPIATS